MQNASSIQYWFQSFEVKGALNHVNDYDLLIPILHKTNPAIWCDS